MAAFRSDRAHGAMSAKVVSRTDTSSDPIARRALDLASDRALPLTDAVRQLLELADARLAPCFGGPGTHLPA
jgi:hypothetical protein